MENQSLLSLLTEEQKSLSQLLALLQQERLNIEQNDAEALVESGEAKNIVLEQLKLTRQQRKDFLAEQGYAHDKNNLEQYIQNLAEEQKITTQSIWLSLEPLLLQCHEHNTLNGCLIAAGCQQNQRALNLYFPPTQTLYNRQGNKDNNEGGQMLTKA